MRIKYYAHIAMKWKDVVNPYKTVRYHMVDIIVIYEVF